VVQADDAIATKAVAFPYSGSASRQLSDAAEWSRTTGYLFLAGEQGDCAAERRFVIAPLRYSVGRQSFVLSRAVPIDLAGLQPDVYRVHLVQDFWSEDTNPVLSDCIAGIFLGRQRLDGAWEEPEHWPIECRSLIVLGTLDARKDRSAFMPSDDRSAPAIRV